MIKNLQYTEKMEKAIEQKYGKIAVMHPLSGWTNSKEAEYKENLKKFVKKLQKADKKKDNRKQLFRVCEKCKKQALMIEDDIAMTKSGYCYYCYIKDGQNGQKR